jgi:murein DD-endopeptidase MepM/ murein hydrolase activator NlpD/Rod binding domain-containing protein
MSTNNISPTTPAATSNAAGSTKQETRARLAELAAEFESMLLVNVLRDMRTSGRWSDADSGADMLGAETFDQTIDVELSRYLSKAGGFGLSKRLLSALDALERITEADPGAAGADAPTRASASRTITPTVTEAPLWGTGEIASTPTLTETHRTGWKSMRLDAPANGGSGAQWAGFNNDRALAGGDDSSVKDAFFRWTYGWSFNPAGHSKEEIATYLRDNIQNAREYGLNILDVNGEQILIETEERGAEWVDVVESAGSPGAKWQWLCQTDFGVVGGGALGAALADLRKSADGDARARAVLTRSTNTGDALLASLRAESAAAALGQPIGAAVDSSTVATRPEVLRTQANTVTSGFGWRQDPFNGQTTFHSGIDVRAAEGDRVTSTGAGRVVFSGTDGGYGTSVVVQHANGLSTRYAHLSAAMVAAGDLIQDGQLLGLAGQTGRATAPHLHYEVRVDGRAVDPLQE